MEIHKITVVKSVIIHAPHAQMVLHNLVRLVFKMVLSCIKDNVKLHVQMDFMLILLLNNACHAILNV